MKRFTIAAALADGPRTGVHGQGRRPVRSPATPTITPNGGLVTTNQVYSPFGGYQTQNVVRLAVGGRAAAVRHRRRVRQHHGQATGSTRYGGCTTAGTTTARRTPTAGTATATTAAGNADEANSETQHGPSLSEAGSCCVSRLPHLDHPALRQHHLVVLADKQQLPADAARRAVVGAHVVRFAAQREHPFGAVRRRVHQRQVNVGGGAVAERERRGAVELVEQRRRPGRAPPSAAPPTAPTGTRRRGTLPAPSRSGRRRRAARRTRAPSMNPRTFGALAQVEAAPGRYSLFTGGVGVALFAAACLDADPRFPVLDGWD